MGGASEWPALCPGEIVLIPGPERLWRQVNAAFIDGTIVGAGAFAGTEDDRLRISTAREEKETPAGAFRFCTTILGMKSAGTWSVSTATVANSRGRSIYDAESECAPSPCPPGHSNIDLRALTKREQREARVLLASEATERGCDYSPTQSFELEAEDGAPAPPASRASAEPAS